MVKLNIGMRSLRKLGAKFLSTTFGTHAACLWTINAWLMFTSPTYTSLIFRLKIYLSIGVVFCCFGLQQKQTNNLTDIYSTRFEVNASSSGGIETLSGITNQIKALMMILSFLLSRVWTPHRSLILKSSILAMFCLFMRFSSPMIPCLSKNPLF